MAPTTMTIKNDAVPLSVKIYSNIHAESIILLHGGPGVPDDMLAVVQQLKEQFQVITFDQRGTGCSKGKECNFTMEDYISDIDAIAKTLDIEEFHLFGHSWGGLYAQIYAEERPDKIKSLFLCSPSSGTNNIWKKTEAEVMQYNRSNASTSEWLKMGWYSLLGMLGSHNAYRNMFRLVIINYNKKYVSMEISEGFLNKIYSEPINKTRKEIVKYKALSKMPKPTFPIIITYGDNDIYGESKKELIERYPIATMKVIEKSGHIPWLHNAMEFSTVMSNFYN